MLAYMGSGGVIPVINLFTTKGQWYTARPVRCIQFQRQTDTLVATVRLCVSCHYSVTLTNKHNTTDPIYRFYIQHCNMFRLSRSAIVSVASVHKRNKKL